MMNNTTMPIHNFELNDLEKKNISSSIKRFEGLYEVYSPRVYGFLLNKAYNESTTEEILIKVFLKVWADIENFNDENDEKKITLFAILACRNNL